MGEIIKFRSAETREAENEFVLTTYAENLWGTVARVIAAVNTQTETSLSIEDINKSIAEGYIWNAKKAVEKCLEILCKWEREVPKFYKPYFDNMSAYFLELFEILENFESESLSAKELNSLETINRVIEKWENWQSKNSINNESEISRSLFSRLNSSVVTN